MRWRTCLSALGLGVAALALLLGQPIDAHGGYKVKIEAFDGSVIPVSTGSTLVEDQMAGDSVIGPTGVGVIAASLAAGGVVVSYTGTSTAELVGASTGALTSTTVGITFSPTYTTRQLVITVTSTDYGVPDPAWLLSRATADNLPTGTTYTLQSYYSTSNTEFDTTGLDVTATDPQVITTTLPLTQPNLEMATISPAALPYSLTHILTIDLPATMGVGSSVTVAAYTEVFAPAPPGTILTLSGAFTLGIGYLFRRFRLPSKLPS